MEEELKKGPPPVGLPAIRFKIASPDPSKFDPIGLGHGELPGNVPYPEKFAVLILVHPSTSEEPIENTTDRISALPTGQKRRIENQASKKRTGYY